MEQEKKKQIVFIGGGSKYATKEDFYRDLKKSDFNPHIKIKTWFDWIAWGLNQEYESFVLTMPNRKDADYEAWKIHFEKHFPYLNDEDLILVGGSMGAIFLIKYLSENELPYKAKQVHLAAPAINDEDQTSSGEILGNFTPDLSKVSNISEQAEEVFLYHSKDDDICPFSHSEKLAELIPNVTFLKFEDRGHFMTSAFPELFNNIPSDIYKGSL